MSKGTPHITLRSRFKPYPDYKDSGVEWLGKIPAHWEVKRLKNIVDASRPITYGIVQCGPNIEGGVPYIRPVDMTEEGGSALESLQRTAPEIAKAYRRSTVIPNDIVVSIGPSFGKVMIVPSELNGANLTQGTARVASEVGVVPRWLFWVLRSSETHQNWDAGCSGATFRALTLELLSETKIAVPSTEEQRAMTSSLDRETAKIDALVTKKERLIELLQEKRAALITQAVTKGLDPTVPMKDSGVEWLGRIPAHWDVKKLKFAVSQTPGAIKTGPFGSQLLASEMLSGDVKVYNQRNVIERNHNYGENYISEEKYEELSSFSVKPGDLLVTTRGTIGRCMVVPKLAERGILHPCLMRIQPRQNLILTEFLLFLIQDSSLIQAQLFFQSNATTIEVIYSDTMRQVVLPLPPIWEQHSIVAHLDHETAKLDALIAKVHEGIEKLEEYRTALVSAAVTGKIDVREESA